MTKKKGNVVLDSQEKELLKSFEKGEWKTVAHLRKEKALAKRAARNYKCCAKKSNVRFWASAALSAS